ncbi:RsmB/NOP family class I SAM-dependent RNA methyltransferase [Clavibacter michiganensis]|uniref:RsmB/NOP family class I SAM-dependent RNA methyltransferase n=1 Tax=Clavibacter michiganensis TaxID=28447 RepID=UPI0026DD0223|nr:transcription antitermination factor NusB [Clavibacter michiganensis]MDO4142895.1 transcription antitermination factor NusB [Clavibacter michiganensis]
MSDSTGSPARRPEGRRTGGTRRPADRGSRPADDRSAVGGPSSVSPARRVAYEVVSAVRESDAYANLLLPVRIRRAALSAQDAALATELAYGTLRMSGYYDRVIELAAGRPVTAIDAPILDVLRLSVHQLLSMRVATHAAVNEGVDMARAVGSRSATGFVNGVLRTITRSEPAEWRQRVLDSAASDDERLALEHSHPLWVLRALRQALAREGRADELEDLLRADNAAPAVSLVALPGLATVEETQEQPAAFSPVGAYLEGGDPMDAPGVAEGRVRVQDEGSQLAALALSRARAVTPGERWLDLCAGPGGKAALLAAEAGRSGALLTANELVPARAGLVRDALRAVAGDTEVWELDGTTVGESHPGAFDRILLDAPCSGLGALRRRPEARWRKTPRDVAGLGALQTGLIDSAIGALAPGGILAYVTCSPHLAETRAIVQAALQRHPDVTALDTRAVLQEVADGDLELPDADPDAGARGSSVQLWPHRHGTDAMFIALLTRR